MIVAACCCLCGMSMADEVDRSAPAGETEKESPSSSISPAWKSKTIHDAKDGKLTYQVDHMDKIDIKVQRIPDDRIIDALRAYEFLFLNKANDDVPEGLKKYFTNEKYMKGGDIRLILEFPARRSIIDCKGKKEVVLSLKDLYDGKLEKGLYQVYAEGVFALKNDSSPFAFATQYRMYSMEGEEALIPSTILVRVGDLKVVQSVESTDGLKTCVYSRSAPERKIEAKVQYLDENGKKMHPEIPAGEVMRVGNDEDVPSFIKVTTPDETFIDWVSV